MIEIRAAQRLLVMARPIPEDLKKDLINRVKQRCRCDEATARHYLIDEEWNFEDAITSYEGDKKHGLHAKKVLADDNGDAERLDQLKTQIRDLEIDVKEIEDDGDDATVERKHLESLRDEQRKLKEKVGVKVGAAARLKLLAARVDPKMLKTFLDSLDLKVKPKKVTDDDAVWLQLMGEDCVSHAVEVLTQHFGKTIREYKTPNGVTNQRVWKVPGKGFINLQGRLHSNVGFVTLFNRPDEQ